MGSCADGMRILQESTGMGQRKRPLDRRRSIENGIDGRTRGLYTPHVARRRVVEGHLGKSIRIVDIRIDFRRVDQLLGHYILDYVDGIGKEIQCNRNTSHLRFEHRGGTS